MRSWIIALVDPRPIESQKGNSNIATPPKFKLPENEQTFPVPQLSASTMRKRELRSASPGKAASTRKIATPRKRRTTKAPKTEEETPSSSLQNGVSASSVEPTPSVASDGAKDDTIRVEIAETQEDVNGVETTHTNVKIVMPASNPDLELPNTSEGLIEKAHEIAVTARKLQADKGKSLKRKADDLDEDVGEGSSSALQEAKRPRVMEEQLKKERVKARALTGIIVATAFA